MKITKELKAWIRSRPNNVQKMIREYPPTTCYRSKLKGKKAHYRLHSYEEQKDGNVTLKVIHGKDSFLPGCLVFGFNPYELTPCGCGKWEPA